MAFKHKYSFEEKERIGFACITHLNLLDYKQVVREHITLLI